VTFLNRQTTGGIPALRGFRKQFLHTLSRILNSDTEVVYPEGIEDFDVYDQMGRLIEIVQVKDHKKPLTFSELDTFFQRSIQIVAQNPKVRIILASYGKLGPELDKNIGADEATLKKNKKFSTPKMLNVFQRLRFQPLQEEDELHNIKIFLIAHPMIAGEWQSAFDLLMQDLYRGAEESRAFTRQTVLKQLQHIGRYLIGRKAHHDEWGTSILSLDNQKTGQPAERLRKTFHEGIAVSWAHISANLDIVREQHLQTIEAGFKEKNVVIVHGASGQGKSALAYRYLHDFCPCATRYEIRDLSTPKRALEVATALAGYGVPLTFYVDASSNDKGLPEFLRRIQDQQHVNCLVTIREEDWRLINITSADFQFTDFELNFDREEAQKIYAAWEHGKDCRFPDFEQAWAKFSEAGPLLEFVYLLIHTKSLRDRLCNQYGRVADEIDCGQRSATDLKLIEYVAVAGAFGARIDLSKLSGDHTLKRSIARLEKEYLLRLSDDKRYLIGLHPIRSTILTDILTDPVIHPWTKLALECLPMLADADIEIFLLHSFISYPEACGAILTYLDNTKLSSWTAVGGVVRGLLWKGVYDYINKNRELIERVYDRSGVGWYVMLDFDLLALSEADSSRSSILDILPEEGKKRCSRWRSQQTPKTEAFTDLNNWLKKLSFPPLPSYEQVRNWQELGQTAYWIGFCGLETDLDEYLDWAVLRHAVKSIPLDSLADVVYGLWHSLANKKYFKQWYAEIRPLLLERYQRETSTVRTEEKETIIRAHFIVPLDENEGTKTERLGNGEESPFHSMALQNVNLLARLIPECTGYGCQGYGHRLFDFDFPDDTTKTAIDAWLLTPPWVTQVNGTARILGDHFFRPATWQDYCSEMLSIRFNTVDCLEELGRTLTKHFRSNKVVKSLSSLPESPQWRQCSRQITNMPKLPLEALDIFGYAEEGRKSSSGDLLHVTQQQPVIAGYLRRYQAYLQKKRDFFGPLSNFLNQSPSFMVANSFLGKTKKGKKRREVKQLIKSTNINVDAPLLSVQNLADAIKTLPHFQSLYHQHFVTLSDQDKLTQLEQRELQTIHKVWCLWFFFITKPSAHWSFPVKVTAAHLDRRKQVIQNNIDKVLVATSTKELQFECIGNHQFEDKEALWITVNGENPIEVFSQTEPLFQLINKAIGIIRLHSIDYYALEFQWQRLVIVPLCRGKLLGDRAWLIPTYQFTDLNKSGSLSKVNLVPREIQPDILTNFGLKIWRLELLKNPRFFLQGTVSLQMHLQHLIQIGEISNVDETGNDIVQSYFDKHTEGLNKDLQIVIDQMEVLTSLYQQATESKQAVSFVEYLQVASEQFQEIIEALIPDSLNDNKVTLTLDRLKEWQGQVASTQEKCFVIYLLWCGYLANITNEK
jgi:hypothetical protein